MKHLAAYLLLGLGGNTSPSAKDIKNLLDSVGIEADEDRLDKLLEELSGKDINEVCDLTRHEDTLGTNSKSSSSPLVPRNSQASHLVVPVVLQPLEVLPLEEPLLRKPRRKRRKRRRRSLTTIWDSVFSIKLLERACTKVWDGENIARINGCNHTSNHVQLVEDL